jgi:hypothetical protein
MKIVLVRLPTAPKERPGHASKESIGDIQYQFRVNKNAAETLIRMPNPARSRELI